MDLVIAGSQGLALAIASGALFGAPGLRGNPGAIPMIGGVVIGAFLYGASLVPEDHPAWPGWLIGAPIALLAFLTARDIALGASGRAGEGGAGGIALFIAAFALALAGLSLLGPVGLIGIPATLALLYIYASRRRKAAEKHAGLRTLR